MQRGVPAPKTLVGSGQAERCPGAVGDRAAAAYAAQLADVVLGARPGAPAAPRGGRAGRRTARAVEQPARVRPRADGARRASAVDREDLGRMGEEFRARKAEIEKRIYELAGHEFNIGSTKQLADVLFEELKLPGREEDEDGLLDRRRGARAARAEARDRAGDPRRSASSRSSSTRTPTCCATRSRPRPAHPRDVPADDGRLGPAHLHRPGSPAHARADARGEAHPHAPSSRPRGRASSRPTGAKSSSGCSRTSAGTRASSRPSGTTSTCTAARRACSSASPPRR